MGKYDALGGFLAGLPDDQHEAELTFGRIDALVGGLPPSARTLRTWWANSSHTQSLAWKRSGWHVRTVDLAGSTVVFARGQVGGSFVERGRRPAGGPVDAVSAWGPPSAQPTPVETVDVRVHFEWSRLGNTALDSAGKIVFPRPLPAAPGLYRFILTASHGRNRIYIGESDNLRRRLTSYRNPGPRQRTNLRVNALLVRHLGAGLSVTVDLAVAAVRHSPGSPDTPLDLSRKAGRLLAESAALVLAQRSATADVENIG